MQVNSLQCCQLHHVPMGSSYGVRTRAYGLRGQYASITPTNHMRIAEVLIPTVLTDLVFDASRGTPRCFTIQVVSTTGYDPAPIESQSMMPPLHHVLVRRGGSTIPKPEGTLGLANQYGHLTACALLGTPETIRTSNLSLRRALLFR